MSLLLFICFGAQLALDPFVLYGELEFFGVEKMYHHNWYPNVMEFFQFHLHDPFLFACGMPLWVCNFLDL